MQRAAVYVPGGRAPYPSTVVMGVVTARAAGVRRGRGLLAARTPTARSTRSCSAACRLAGAGEVYRMGGAQAIAALAYGTETVHAGRRDRRPGQPVRAGGQAPALRAGRDRLVRGPERSARDRRRGIDPAPIALDLLAQGEHGHGTLVVGASTSRSAARGARSSGSRRRSETGAVCRLVRASPIRRGAARFAQAFAPEHLELIGPRGRRARSADHAGPAACSSARRPRRRSATTSPAPTTSCRPAARPASPRRCRPRTSGAASPRCGSPTARSWRGGGAGRPRRGIRAPRAVDGGADQR